MVEGGGKAFNNSPKKKKKKKAPITKMVAAFFFFFFYILNTALNLQEVFKELTTRRRALEDEIMSRRIASAAVRSTLKPVTSNRGRLNKTTQPL